MPESPLIFDRALIRRRQRRAHALGAATFLLDRAANDLSDRLGAVLRRFDIAVDLATPTDAARKALQGGVPAVYVSSSRVPRPVFVALTEESGTKFTLPSKQKDTANAGT